MALLLRDAGMEVIYTGIRNSIDAIVHTALQEDVQIIGLSMLSGAHLVVATAPRALARTGHGGRQSRGGWGDSRGRYPCTQDLRWWQRYSQVGCRLRT